VADTGTAVSAGYNRVVGDETYYKTLIRTSSALGGATSTSSIERGLADRQSCSALYCPQIPPKGRHVPASHAIAALQVIVYLYQLLYLCTN
jgi:hypothetical protein